jgi:hypothetical protein
MQLSLNNSTDDAKHRGQWVKGEGGKSVFRLSPLARRAWQIIEYEFLLKSASFKKRPAKYDRKERFKNFFEASLQEGEHARI